MFKKSSEELTQLGAHITTHEIFQQSDLWKQTYDVYTQHKQEIAAFLNGVVAGKGNHEAVRVIFAGAGTSAYVGDTLVPYLRRSAQTSPYEFCARATTDIVSAPYDFIRPDDPTLFVSFARSGNSPESLAAIERVEQVATNVHFLNITCAPEGKLAVQSANNPRAYTVLLPFANDQGFAMTGSFTCMLLLAALIFDPLEDARKQQLVEQIAQLGKNITDLSLIHISEPTRQYS